MNIDPSLSVASVQQALQSQLTAKIEQSAPKGLTDASGKKTFSPQEKKDLAKATRGFESMFASMMMKQMRESMLENNTSEGNLSFGADTLSGLTDMQFGEYVAERNGLGLAHEMYKHITGETLNPVKELTGAISRPSEQRGIPFQSPSTANKEQNIANITSKTGIHLEPQSIAYELLHQTINEHSLSQEETHVEPNASLSSPENSTLSLLSQLGAQPIQPLQNNDFLERALSRIEPFDDMIRQASTVFDVPEHVIKAVIIQESAGKPTAQSPAGAKGLMQLMDSTAKDVGVSNSYDPMQNIYGGTKYLRQMLDKFGGNMRLALAGYNAGPGNVDKFGGIPPFRETQAYVRNVQRYAETLSQIV